MERTPDRIIREIAALTEYCEWATSKGYIAEAKKVATQVLALGDELNAHPDWDGPKI